MSATGRNTWVQTFAKVTDSFIDRCLWQVVPDLLHCTFLALEWSLALGECGILRRKSAANACWRLQTVASIWIRVSARRRSCAHGPSDAGLVDDKLYQLHRKGPMATKFTRPQPTWLPCVGRNASGISQTSPKATDHSRAKKCIVADLGRLATDNDQ